MPLEERRVKKFINNYNLGHNILELYVLVEIRLTKVNRNVVSSIADLVYELPHQLPNDLRFRILGKKKILGKSQIWVEPSAQYPFQKLNFGNSSPKTR